MPARTATYSPDFQNFLDTVALKWAWSEYGSQGYQRGKYRRSANFKVKLLENERR